MSIYPGPHPDPSVPGTPDASDALAEEGVDLTDADEQLAQSPEEKRNRTDGADASGTPRPGEDRGATER